MQDILDTFTNTLSGGLLNLLAALAILIIGYIIARLLGGLTKRIMGRFNIDNRIADGFTNDFDLPHINIESLTGSIVFWIIILFAIGAAVQQMGLSAITAAINPLLATITNVYVPGLVSALLLALLAWIVAVILRAIVVRLCKLAKLDERLNQEGAVKEEEAVSVTDTLGTLTFWLTILLFVPAILDVLGITAISEPFQNAVTAFFDYLPNVVAASVLLLVGWLVARVLRTLVVSLFGAIRVVDDLGERIGLTGENTLSRLLGTLTYAVIMLLVLIAALDALDIDAISGPATSMLMIILDAIPAFIGAVLVLVIAYFIARLVSQLIVDILTGLNFDLWPGKLGINYTGTRTPSQLVGYLVMIGIILLSAVAAADLLNSTAVSEILNEIVQFFFQVVLALVILGIGLYFANLVRDIVDSAAGANGRFWGSAARMIIIILTVAMALGQLGLASDIVNLAFGITLAAIAFAAALAFGLGSRETAGREVENALSSWRTSHPAVAEAADAADAAASAPAADASADDAVAA